MLASRSSRVLTIVSAATFMAGLDLFIVNVAFPDIQRSLDTSDATLSWVLNAYTILFASLPVVLGRLADLYGRKRGFVAGVTLFTVASTLCALAPSVEWLIAARALQGIGAAALMPTSLGLLLGEFPAERRPAAVAIWAAAGSVAAAAGPPLGGLLVQLGWQWVFLVNLPIGAAVAIAAVRVLREVREEGDRRLPDLAGALVLVLGVGALTLGIVEGPTWAWGDARTLGALVLGALLLLVFARRCTRHPAPVLEPSLLRTPLFAAANLASLLFFVGFSAMLLGSILFLTRIWHESTLTAGLEFAPGPAMAAVWSVPGGRLAARFGLRAVAAGGSLLFGASALYFLATMDLDPAYASTFLPSVVLGGSGVGLVLPTLAAAVTSGLPPARRATGSAVYSMSRQLGAVLGVAGFVSLLDGAGGGDPLDGFRHGWILVAGAAFVAACAAATLRATPAAAPAEVSAVESRPVEAQA